jgi:hypothetical protein
MILQTKWAIHFMPLSQHWNTHSLKRPPFIPSVCPHSLVASAMDTQVATVHFFFDDSLCSKSILMFAIQRCFYLKITRHKSVVHDDNVSRVACKNQVSSSKVKITFVFQSHALILNYHVRHDGDQYHRSDYFPWPI